MRNIEWTKDNDEKLLDMRRRGLTFAVCGRLLGVTRNAAQGRWYRVTGAHEKRTPRFKPEVVQRDRQVVVKDWRKSKDIKPAKYPYAADCSCPAFAWDDQHCAAVLAAGGYSAFKFRTAA